VSNDYHAVVWVNHAEAKVCRFKGNEESESDVHSHTSLQRLHHRATGWEAGGNTPDDTEFFKRIHGALEHSESTVIAGPGNAKSELKSYLDRLNPDVVSQVSTVETMGDHPADGALLELGRRYFDSGPALQLGLERARASS